ncbi:Chk1 protein kinase, partial [Rhizophlyctis rosea]
TPWAEPTDHDVEYRAYLKEYPRPTFEPWDRVPAAVIELLTGILNPDPTRRYTIDMIRSNSWFRSENPLLTDGRCNNPEHLAERMMSQATMDVDLPPIAYSQPTDMRADNYSPNMEDASPEQRHVVSFSQPVGMAIDSNTQNASPEGTLSQARGGFIDFFRSERATRFYSYHDAASISHNLHSVLEGFLVPWKHHGQMTISFTTVDKRKCPLHGEVSIHAAQDGLHLVHFRKSKGDPMEFKRFYKSVRDALGEIVAT